MSDTDFQNGFVCGLATKGLGMGSATYEPKIWNDDGVFTYIYVDFKQGIEDFSQGMFNESCVVSNAMALAVTDVERVSESVFKIYVNISDAFFGATLTNKVNSLLTVARDKSVLKPFSVHCDVAGLTNNLRLKYLYDKMTYNNATGNFIESINEIFTDENIEMWTTVDVESVSESYFGLKNDIAGLISSTNETVSIVLT